MFGTAAVLLSLPFYWYGMKVLGAAGIAMAVTLSAIFQVVLLYALWNKRSNNKESHRVYLFYGRIILISVPIGLILEWVKTILLSGFDSSTLLSSSIVCIVTGVVFMAMLIVMGYLLRIDEIIDLVGRLTKKGFRGKKRG